MDYAEYKKLKDMLESDYKKRVEALEMVWHMSQGQAVGQSNTDDKPKISISNAMRKVIDGLSGSFTADDILQGLQDHSFGGMQRIQVTNTLHRLMRKKELEVVEKGVGRTGSKYRKVVKTEA